MVRFRAQHAEVVSGMRTDCDSNNRRRCSDSNQHPGWSDVGSWASLWEIAPKDKDGNAAMGNAAVLGSKRDLQHVQRTLIDVAGFFELARGLGECSNASESARDIRVQRRLA